MTDTKWSEENEDNYWAFNYADRSKLSDYSVELYFSTILVSEPKCLSSMLFNQRMVRCKHFSVHLWAIYSSNYINKWIQIMFLFPNETKHAMFQVSHSYGHVYVSSCEMPFLQILFRIIQHNIKELFSILLKLQKR